MKDALADAEADRVLVISLEVGQYWPHERNLRGDKEVRLGRGHAVAVPCLVSFGVHELLTEAEPWIRP